MKAFFEKGGKIASNNPWFVLPYTRVYCTCLEISLFLVIKLMKFNLLTWDLMSFEAIF